MQHLLSVIKDISNKGQMLRVFLKLPSVIYKGMRIYSKTCTITDKGKRNEFQHEGRIKLWNENAEDYYFCI